MVDQLIEGRLLRRENRFKVLVEVEGQRVAAHLKDTARLRDLMIFRNRLLLRRVPHNPRRKTGWDVWGAWHPSRRKWVLLNSHVHVDIAAHLLASLKGGTYLKEVSSRRLRELIGKHNLELRSRFDLLRMPHREGTEIELIEVKGVTLFSGRTALFPDAPTGRGRRHLEEMSKLLEALKGQFRASLIFLIFDDEVLELRPNSEVDPNFVEALERFLGAGGRAQAFALRTDVKELQHVRRLEVTLSHPVAVKLR